MSQANGDSSDLFSVGDDFDLSLLADGEMGNEMATSGSLSADLTCTTAPGATFPGMQPTPAWDFQGLATGTQPYEFHRGFPSGSYFHGNWEDAHLQPTAGGSQQPVSMASHASSMEAFVEPTKFWNSNEVATNAALFSNATHSQMRDSFARASSENVQQSMKRPTGAYASPESASTTNSPAKRTKTSLSVSSDTSEPSKNAKARRGKRKSEDIEDDEEYEEDEDGRPVKKTAHNEIEKRYRNNINDKISELRDAVPSLRIMYKNSRGEDTTEDREELEGLTPAHKLNKGTVLSKATEYILHLKKRNNRLMDENRALHAKIAVLHKHQSNRAAAGFTGPIGPPRSVLHSPRPLSQHSTASPSAMQDTMASPAGMIEVPQDMRQIISASSAYGQPYPVPQQPYMSGIPNVSYQVQNRQQQSPQQGRHGIPYLGKLMVGSIAGIMILQSTREDETSNEKTDGRGLFAISTELFSHLASSFNIPSLELNILKSFKFLLLLGLLLWIWVPRLFEGSKPEPKVDIMSLRAAPSLASSVQVRRQAWLTAVQTVWVPRHNFILEALALLLKIVKITLRNAIGVRGFQLLTGLTEEQEKARVKAWMIALDSQLVGGDMEINNSRLALTLLASYTLPASPIRLMLRALHFRVLFWSFTSSRVLSLLLNALAAKMARSSWIEAHQLNQVLSQLPKTSIEREDELPEHLALLVEQDCDVALSRDVIQRACNLAFNLDTTSNVDTPIDGMDAVIEDLTIGSPMDAVAAWWSTELLHHVVMGTLFKSRHVLTSPTAQLLLASKIAPDGSIAQIRATVAQAVLIEEDRQAHINTALQAISPKQDQQFINNSISTVHPVSSSQISDLKHCMRCAVALAYLQHSEDTSIMSPKARQLIKSIRILGSMSLLGFTSAMQLVDTLSANKRYIEVSRPSVERITGGLRRWMGGLPGEKSGIDSVVRLEVVDRCLVIIKSLVGMDSDQGYGSISEGEEKEGLTKPV